MAKRDDIIARVEQFNESHGGGVAVEQRSGGYTLLLRETRAPIARLKPTGLEDQVRILYWSHRSRWDDAGPLGGVFLPLDKALKFIAQEPIFWNRN